MKDDERGAELSLREIQMALLAMLQDFDAFCKANGIAYTLAYGTVLGAARHKGFIPWDDDLDLYVLRDDYERIIDLLQDDSIAFRKKYSYICERNSTCPFLKILDNSIIAEDVAMAGYDGIGITSLWLDVFPLDPVYDNPQLQKEQFEKSKHLQNLYFYSRMRSEHEDMSLSRRLKRFVARVYGTKNVVKRMHAFARSKRVNTGVVGDLIWCPYSNGDAMHAVDISQPAILEFEGDEYPVPKDYDDYLSKVYGDYMRLPPEDKRRNHGLKCWKKLDLDRHAETTR